MSNILNLSLRCNSLTAVSSFLLVSLNIDVILSEITLYQRRKKLDEMTKGEGLGDAYEATLSRVKAQPRSRAELGMKVLMWVSHAERPLRVDELCHALGVEKGSVELITRNIPAIETLLACSQGLVTVEKSSSTVRLVHYTLQEYLSNNPNLFIEPHSLIAEVCLTYLNFQHVMDLAPTLDSVPPTAPFVEYASCHWGSHARRGNNENVKTLALKLLAEYDKHISSKILLLRGLNVWDQPFDLKNTPAGFTGLHGAAYLGCEEITAALLETNKWDARATDLRGNTAIAWAAWRGHEGVVRVLLEWSGINPDTSDTIYGRTPLMLAIKNGHEGVVRILLERNDVNPDKADKWGQTPLLLAAENGLQGAVKMLLKRNNVDPNTIAAKYGQIPLQWAAKNGHEGVVKMLLERNGVDPDGADEWRRTPLSLAAENGHEGIAKMLVERNDVNPDIADTEYGRTPLSWAANNGHEGVVRLLLRQSDISLNTVGTKHGQRLLFANRHEGVKLLLEQKDINPDKTDTEYGRTPLWWATKNGYEGIAKLLRDRAHLMPKHVYN